MFKFSEYDYEISPDSIDELLEKINDLNKSFSNNKTIAVSLLNELSKFRNKEKNLDQIDISVSLLEQMENDIERVVSNTKRILENLNDYKENGRKK